MIKTSLLLMASVAGVQMMSAKLDDAGKVPPNYVKEVEAWRSGRIERLTAPSGWLSLIGLHWLKEGKNTVGSGKDNDVVLSTGPARIGVISVKGNEVSIELDPKSAATIDGSERNSARLVDDSQEKPTTVAFGTASFYLIDRGGRKGLRVKDSEAQTRKQFLGIDNYPIDPTWRVEAKWQAYTPPHTLDVPTVLGTVDKLPVPGKAVFERDGKTYELLPVLEEPDAKELFFIFADRTSGKSTYGAGRFVYADMPRDGKVVIDFNKSYNPPCAFTPHATCPLAPPENRLDLSIVAGEKKYRGSHH